MANQFRRTAINLAAISALALTVPCLAAAGPTIKIDRGASLPVPTGWSQVTRPGRQGELVRRVPRGNPNGARVILHTETRASHADAVRRLADIAAESKTPSQFLAIDGWPALQRRQTIPAPHQGVDDKDTPKSEPDLFLITTAVAAGALLVRLEGWVQTTADPAVSLEVQQIGGGLTFTARADAAQTALDLAQLRGKRPPPSPVKRSSPSPTKRPPPSPGPAATAPPTPPGRGPAPGAPVNVTQSTGELEVATSPDGRNVVIGSGLGTNLSTNGGVSFAGFVFPTPVTYRKDGDGSIARGATGSFYYAFLSFPDGSANAFNVNGCAATVATSATGAGAFTTTGHAAFCSNSGGDCAPDQEHIAADPANQGLTGKDQVYVVWREFGSFWSTDCPTGSLTGPTPRISCSIDSGKTWTAAVDIDSGDFPRAAVAEDGFVYAVYLSGETVMLNKYSSCKNGLQQQPNFPVSVADLEEIDCPVPGLDRCNDGNTLSSPMVAIDHNSPNHIYVAFTTHTSDTNDDILVFDSSDGGATWPRSVRVNQGVDGRRFLPWACTLGSVAQVGWYDRRAAVNGASNDLTAYFRGSAQVQGNQLVAGAEVNVSGVNDPQCAPSWTACGSRDDDDFESCTNPPAGNVNTCGTCGCPRYGDYNGIACAAGHVFSAWASGTPPPGVTAAGPGINVYVDALPCSDNGQPCCATGAPCKAGLLCQSQFCTPCGDVAQPCCPTGGPACNPSLVCDANNLCTCGFGGQPCCPGGGCSPGFTCAVVGETNICQCGNLSQPCCGGTTCTSDNLVCSAADGFTCISACGHQGQPCCHSPVDQPPPTHAGNLPGWCFGPDTCANDTCVCGGLDQPCCKVGSSCDFGLTCANLVCIKGGGTTCTECAKNLAQCLQGCNLDPQHKALCQCLCHNTECDCLQQNSCGFCQFQSCSGQ